MTVCAESQATSRDPNRTRFLEVRTDIRVKMPCDKKTLLAEEDVSKKRNLMLVGGHADNVVDLCEEGNAKAPIPWQGTDYAHDPEVTEPSYKYTDTQGHRYEVRICH